MRFVVAMMLLLPACTGEVEVLDPSAPVADHTYAEWSARWWEWSFTAPVSSHPLLDLTGEDCAVGQTYDVWMLGGSFGEDATRTCTIPKGKPVFFPIMNTHADNCGSPPEEVVDGPTLEGWATESVEGLVDAHLTVDDLDYPDLASLAAFRTPAAEFSYEVAGGAEGLFDYLYGPYGYSFGGTCEGAYGDGYYVAVELPKGEHTIAFGAAKETWSLSITYHLTVE